MTLEAKLFTLLTARTKLSAVLEQLKKDGFDSTAEELTLKIAGEVADQVVLEKCIAMQAEFERCQQQVMQQLEAGQFCEKQIQKLLDKYMNEKRAEVTDLLKAKIKECEALRNQPGVQASEVAARSDLLRDALTTLQRAAERRSKSRRTPKSS